MFILHKKITNIILNRNHHTKIPKSFKTKIVYILTAFGLGSIGAYYLFPTSETTETISNQPRISGNNTEIESKFNLNTLPKLNSHNELANGGKNNNFINKVVELCAPGVFHILITKTKLNSNEDTEISPFIYGSGFVIREDGYALTNAHVVLNKDSHISCKMADGQIYSAELIDMDVNVDVALLKLNTNKEKLTACTLEAPGVVDIGEWVVALGSPLSLSNSISVGVVSSLNRSAKELGLKNYSMSYIQTDALITFGNSGGPLVNLDGKVIGISSLRLTSGISFAIPVEYCIKFLRNCKEFNPGTGSGSEDYPDERMKYFGLTTISINPDILMELARKDLYSFPQKACEGLLIWKILDGSVAKEYGLEVGDIITHIDGVPVKSSRDIYRNRNKDTVEFIVIKKTNQEISIQLPTK